MAIFGQSLFNITRIVLFLTLSLLMSSSSGASESRRLYFDLGLESGWIPFHRDFDGQSPGVFRLVTRAITQQTGIEFIPVNLPPKRAELALQAGLVDFDFVCLQWFADGNPGEQFVLSEPLFSIREYIITLKENAYKFAQPESYKGKPIGTIAGYFYHNAEDFIRVDFLSESLLMQGLQKQRFEGIIMEQGTATHWARVHDVDIAFATLHSDGYLRIRLHNKYQPYLPEINSAIKSLRESGEMAKILKQFSLEELAIPTPLNEN